MNEFYLLGDKERAAGLPPTPMYQRGNSVDMAQKGFITFIVQPLYKGMAVMLPEAQVCFDTLNANLAAILERLPKAPAK